MIRIRRPSVFKTLKSLVPRSVAPGEDGRKGEPGFPLRIMRERRWEFRSELKKLKEARENAIDSVQ